MAYRGAFLHHLAGTLGPDTATQQAPRAKPDDLATTNADGTLIYKHAKGAWGVFPAAGKDPIAIVESTCAPTFSRSDPTVLYVVGGAVRHTIQAVVLDTSGVVRIEDKLNLDHLLLGLTVPSVVGGLGASDQSLVFFFGGETPNTHMWVGVWLEREDAPAYLLNTQREPGLGFLLHDVSVDLSGRYLVLDPVGGPDEWVLDLHDGTATRLPPGPSPLPTP
jgi:hypothetical protein